MGERQALTQTHNPITGPEGCEAAGQKKAATPPPFHHSPARLWRLNSVFLPQVSELTRWARQQLYVYGDS